MFFLYLFLISDEIDVIGYSNNSDDDYSSVQSLKSALSSDSGVEMSASRLTLSEIDNV
jgi:hypothetical protein